MIDCLLIANRGEIAIRIAKTASRLGVRSVGVFTPADRGALHTSRVDVAVEIDDYLNADSLIEVAQRLGAKAVHPGVGFLAERPDFADAVSNAGLIWVGPPAAAISAMGSKAEARASMAEAGVRVLPGYNGTDQSDATLLAEALNIGFPLIIKPSAGGGGKGMAVVQAEAEFEEALASARRISQASFGDDQMVLERYVARARHIEVQILADTHGNCLHLHERECSIQRRHQKVIEEAPSCAFELPESRERLFDDALKAARAVDYEGAGTVEFVVDGEGNAYFLEMNTRLQVEHPVTEMVVGLDLVEWQLRVASGEQLPFKQEEIQPCGWAMEARIYAENPAAGHAPSSGVLGVWNPPSEVRVDSGVEAGSEVSSLYDPMLAKIAARGDTRQDAIRHLSHALDTLDALGVHTNRDELRWVLRHDAYQSGDLHTGFLTEHAQPLGSGLDLALCAAAAADWLDRPTGLLPGLGKNWRNNRYRAVEMGFGHDEAIHTVSLLDEGSHLVINGRVVRAERRGERMQLEVDGVLANSVVYADGNKRWVNTSESDVLLIKEERFVPPNSRTPPGALTAPLGGAVVRIDVAKGDSISEGQVLVVLEAMKMEQAVVAPRDGVVAELHAAQGDQVDMGAVLVVLEPEG